MSASDPWAVDWREHGSNALLSLTDLYGVKIETPQDRRWLWEIETVLGVGATTDSQRALVRRLRAYLNATCEHHWFASDGDEDIPAHRQCMWCSTVEWADERADR